MSESSKTNVKDFVFQCKKRLGCATSVAKQALASSQSEKKERYDRKAVERQLQPGDKVPVLLTPGSALSARFSGPYVVENKLSDTEDDKTSYLQDFVIGEFHFE